jgi:hypothetical protein
MVLFEETGSLDNNISNEKCDSSNEFKEFYDQHTVILLHVYCYAWVSNVYFFHKFAF